MTDKFIEFTLTEDELKEWLELFDKITIKGKDGDSYPAMFRPDFEDNCARMCAITNKYRTPDGYETLDINFKTGKCSFSPYIEPSRTLTLEAK